MNEYNEISIQPPGFAPNSIRSVKSLQTNSFQSVEPLQCSPSILRRNPKLPLHFDLPHPPRISNKPHQSLTNIPDVIVLMQELGISFACGIGVATGITNG